jgi:hypothetical protein
LTDSISLCWWINPLTPNNLKDVAQ